MEARDVIRILDEAVRARGSAPEFIRSDNGPEFVALAVQDWIARRGFKTLDIAPGSPWQTAYSESFTSRFRDEFLNREAFASVLAAKVLGKQHRPRHNHERPHSSLAYQTPVELAPRSFAAASATLRQAQSCAPSTDHQTHNPNPKTNEKLPSQVDQSSGAGHSEDDSISPSFVLYGDGSAANPSPRRMTVVVVATMPLCKMDCFIDG
jgi:hypothetical protein